MSLLQLIEKQFEISSEITINSCGKLMRYKQERKRKAELRYWVPEELIPPSDKTKCLSISTR